MNDFSDEGWVQAESRRKYHCEQMEEIQSFFLAKNALFIKA
jgi:hypothetical protein